MRPVLTYRMVIVVFAVRRAVEVDFERGEGHAQGGRDHRTCRGDIRDVTLATEIKLAYIGY